MTTTINLEKGARINLAKADGGVLKQIKMGLGWDPARGDSIDLDASCILMNDAKQVLDQVWFRQLKSKCGNVKHSGDNLTGDGDGDDEVITVNLEGLKPEVKQLVFVVSSFRGQSFDEVANAGCRIYDGNNVLTSYNLAEKGSHTGLIMVSVYRHNDSWKVKALGHPTSGRTAGEMLNDIVAVI
jgi:tellurium resistance protein TerZ